jgi:hypothetical protein
MTTRSLATFTDEFHEMFQGVANVISQLFKRIVLPLGSLHLTLMAAIGIWLWSDPHRFEQSHSKNLTNSTSDQLPLECTSIALLNHDIKLTSAHPRQWSLIIYSWFLIPGLNLLLPALLFLALHIYVPGWLLPLKCLKRLSNARSRHSVVPTSVRLVVLLVINIMFLVDVETTIRRAKIRQDHSESEWSFGQTLALLLLSLPLRDVFEFILQVQEQKRRERYTQQLRQAVERKDLLKVQQLEKYADVRVAAHGAVSKLLGIENMTNQTTQMNFHQLFKLPHSTAISSLCIFCYMRRQMSTSEVTITTGLWL